MSAGKGDTPRPLSVSRDAFAAAYERTFGGACTCTTSSSPYPDPEPDGSCPLCGKRSRRAARREMSDPATCEHRNKQLIGGALDGSWDKFICADCGTFKVFI